MKKNRPYFVSEETMNKDDLQISRYVLTPHAWEKLEARQISKNELDSILKEPDDVIPQGPKYLLAKNFPGRSDNNLAAVILKKEDLWIVITVMVNFQKY